VSDSEDQEAVRTFGGDSKGTAWAALDASAWTDPPTSSSTEKATTSQQHDTDDPHERTDWYEPPYNPTRLAVLKERSETHARCVHSKAQGVAGHGFEIVPHEHAKADEPPGYEAVRDFWFGFDTTWQLGPDRLPATASEVLEHAWDDYESIGWLAIEALINDNTADPTGLAHVPAHTIRARRDGPGFVQIDPDSNLIEGHFAPAGARYGDEQLFVDADTGDTGSSIREIGEPANELLVMRDYSALAPHYGVPDIIPAMQTLFGDIAARKYNAKFFENDGVPRFAVVVEGGELSERAWTELEEKFKDLRLDENSHRGVLIEAAAGVKDSFEDKYDVNIRIEPLTVGVEEDASFIDYRKENEHDIMKAHDVPPVVANRTESINYANAESQRRQFANETIRPKQQKLAARLHRIIHQTMLDVDGWTIEFELHGAENEERQANIALTRIKAGVQAGMTVDEAREELGLEPLGAPEGNLMLAELGNSGSTATVEAAIEAEREQARAEVRAETMGYSVTDRADAEADD
jgi:PBSX family phage portal protein